MRAEDLKKAYPGMPDHMRKMVEQEVKSRMNGSKKTLRISGKKAAVWIVAATLALGTTAFAGTRLYRMYMEKTGMYSVNTGVTSEGSQEAQAQIPKMTAVPGYISEGLTETEPGKYSSADTYAQGGISLCLYRMDEGMDAFRMTDTGVVSSEELDMNGTQGIYLEFQNDADGSLSFDKRIYLLYPEESYVLEIFAGEDVSKEEALKTAESITLAPAEPGVEGVPCVDWSFAGESENQEGETYNPQLASKMDRIYAVGDTLNVETLAGAGTVDATVEAKVTDVQVLDDISALDPAYLGEEFRRETDAEGRLLPRTIQYIKSGDGVNSLDEIVSTREVNQKLVYVTVEYTNPGDTAMQEILYWGSVMPLREKDGIYHIDWAENESPEEGEAWDSAAPSGSLQLGGEMIYYDVAGGERQNNYLDNLEPGETKTVHIGFVVDEDKTDELYLNLDPYGSSFEFTEQMLSTGLVDIRR